MEGKAEAFTAAVPSAVVHCTFPWEYKKGLTSTAYLRNQRSAMWGGGNEEVSGGQWEGSCSKSTQSESAYHPKAIFPPFFQNLGGTRTGILKSPPHPELPALLTTPPAGYTRLKWLGTSHNQFPHFNSHKESW